jgi:hypothetical protein
MLRFLYRAVLHAHPPYFRQRFSDEMQAIFDQADTELTKARLLADAVFSLARQWMLRPQFWEEPAPVAAEGGTALFSSLASSKPRTLALFSGAILSALVLNGVSLTIGYAWEHPIFIEIRRPTIVPPAAWKARPVVKPGASTPVEPYLFTDQGRVLLVFNSPAHPSPQPQSTAKPTSEAEMSTVPLADIAPAPTNNIVDTRPSFCRPMPEPTSVQRQWSASDRVDRQRALAVGSCRRVPRSARAVT